MVDVVGAVGVVRPSARFGLCCCCCSRFAVRLIKTHYHKHKLKQGAARSSPNADKKGHAEIKVKLSEQPKVNFKGFSRDERADCLTFSQAAPWVDASVWGEVHLMQFPCQTARSTTAFWGLVVVSTILMALRTIRTRQVIPARSPPWPHKLCRTCSNVQPY